MFGNLYIVKIYKENSPEEVETIIDKFNKLFFKKDEMSDDNNNFIGWYLFTSSFNDWNTIIKQIKKFGIQYDIVIF